MFSVQVLALEWLNARHVPERLDFLQRETRAYSYVYIYNYLALYRK